MSSTNQLIKWPKYKWPDIQSTNVDWTNETVLCLWSPTYFVNTVQLVT